MEVKRIRDFDIIFKKGTSKTAIVVLHGYGASFQDLAPLHQLLDPTGVFNWYFVDGPQSVDVGMGMTGKAWFPIDMMGLQMAIANGTFEKVFADHQPIGLSEISKRLIPLLEDISNESEKLYLGGFSQGSMVCSSIAQERSELVSKLFLLSSSIYNEVKFEELAPKLSQIPTFQSHGIGDPVLPFKMAQKLNVVLNKHIEEYEFHDFSGGHEIPMNVLQSLKKFLER